jgi:hypothetical protein
VTEVSDYFVIMVKGSVSTRFSQATSSYAKLFRLHQDTDTLMSSQPIFKVIFMNQGKVFEVYARSVSHGSLFGFIEVEELVFNSRSTVVVDPSEERIQSEFSGVTRTYLPLHSIIRIDEVEKQGVSKVSNVEGSNVAQFPVPMYAPSGEGGKGGPGEK